MIAIPPSTTPLGFWLYLGAVHALYALLFAAGIAAADPPDWPLDVSVRGFIGVVDVIAAPALVYAWIWRRKPLTGLIGAAVIALAGALVARALIGDAEFAQLVRLAPRPDTLLIAATAAVLVVHELRIVFALAKLRRHPGFDDAIGDITTPQPGDAAAIRKLRQIAAIELRFWAYTLLRTRPQPDRFRGRQHFGYAEQSGNAATWTAWAWINAAPTPVLHFIIDQFDPVLAWITTIATLSGSMWCIAEARAARARPVSIDDDTLYLRYGLTVDRTIPRSSLRSARLLQWQDMDARGVSPYAGCGGANVRLEIDGGEVIHIGLDDPGGFIAAVTG